MNDKLKIFGAFILGALTGAGTLYVYGRDKFIKKDIFEKEISSAREDYARMHEELLSEKRQLEEEKKQLAEKNVLEKARIMDDYKKGLSSFGYVDEVLGNANEHLESKPVTELEEPEPIIFDVEEKPKPKNEQQDKDEKIYMIGEEDFAEFGYDIRDITFYDNGIVTDEVGEVIDRPEDILGDAMIEILKGYSEGGFNEVYVRNDNMKLDIDVELAGTDFFKS